MAEATAVQGNVPAAEPAHVVNDVEPVKNYFKVYDPDPDQQMKLTTLASYLRGDKKEYNEIEMSRDLTNLMFKLGTPPLGASILDHAYNYAKIARQIKDLESERAKFER